MKPYLRTLPLSGLLAAAVAGAQALPDTTPTAQPRTGPRVAPATTPAAPSRRGTAPAATPRPLATPRPTTLERPAPLSSPVPGTAGTQRDGQAPARTAPRVGVPDKIYDRDGRLLPGMRSAGPHRVLDTRTGRYYDSVPAGDGQRIVRPKDP